jgi:predicted DNA-binding protein YlxM (UPF0122 family)
MVKISVDDVIIKSISEINDENIDTYLKLQAEILRNRAIRKGVYALVILELHIANVENLANFSAVLTDKLSAKIESSADDLTIDEIIKSVRFLNKEVYDNLNLIKKVVYEIKECIDSLSNSNSNSSD